jgi:two-component system, NtrC family, sensor kinase
MASPACCRVNLEKVIQHSKRADSVVKNMLLHSRQGVRERQPIDINSLVEASLNRVCYGARSEAQGFSIPLQRSFDPAANEKSQNRTRSIYGVSDRSA